MEIILIYTYVPKYQEGGKYSAFSSVFFFHSLSIFSSYF